MERSASAVKIGLRRLLRAVVFSSRSGTSRIRNPLFWRLLYRLLDTRAAVFALAAACRLASRVEPSLTPEDVADRFQHVFMYGWPHHLGTPWVNLDVLRLHSRVRGALRGGTRSPLRSPRPTSARLRIGVLANLESTLTFARPFFEHVPDHVEVFAFDLARRNAEAGYLERTVEGYAAPDPERPASVIAAIEAAGLDVLLVDVYKHKANVYAVFDGISVPCIVDIGSTVRFWFHDDVAFRYYGLEQADYRIRDERLFCATSHAFLSEKPVYGRPLLFETRGLENPAPRPWRERDPLLVFHGKLYKASEAWLETVFGLLADDASLELVVMGRGTRAELDRIRAAARRHGAESRFHYEGEFRLKRNDEGEVDDPSWLRLVEILRRARLAPDPWPLGGAYSRVEAYAAGLPLVHMGIRHDPDSWRLPQPAVTADHPALNVPRGLAYTEGDYARLCRKVLSDEEFADSLAAEQAALVGRLADPLRFWGDILDCYGTWLERPIPN